LDSTLDEGPNKLEAQKLLLRSGSKLLDFLYQRLHNPHLLLRNIMPPGHSGSKYGGVLELLKPENFAVRGLVLGVESLCPPAGIIFGCLEGEVGDIWAHLATEATGLELQRTPNNENSVPQRPVGFNPQETFTERDEARNV
jgi:hypothetical protein